MASHGKVPPLPVDVKLRLYKDMHEVARKLAREVLERQHEPSSEWLSAKVLQFVAPVAGLSRSLLAFHLGMLVAHWIDRGDA